MKSCLCLEPLLFVKSEHPVTYRIGSSLKPTTAGSFCICAARRVDLRLLRSPRRWQLSSWVQMGGVLGTQALRGTSGTHIHLCSWSRLKRCQQPFKEQLFILNQIQQACLEHLLCADKSQHRGSRMLDVAGCQGLTSVGVQCDRPATLLPSPT